jgi:hypothetical protein
MPDLEIDTVSFGRIALQEGWTATFKFPIVRESGTEIGTVDIALKWNHNGLRSRDVPASITLSAKIENAPVAIKPETIEVKHG